MGDLQHFCLRWNNYQSSITSAFENLRDDEDFVDVTLACEGKSLKAHRVVLSACSPYFRELLKSTPCKHPVIVLQDVVFEDLHALVEFIYHGEVNVHQQSLSSFLKTAEVLRVSGLTQQAEASGIGEKWCREGIPEERGGSPSHLLSRPGRPPLTSHHHRGPHRERPSSAGEVSDQQDNSVPMKRAKTSSNNNDLLNHMSGDNQQPQSQSSSGGNKPESESDQEPPVDFSTSTLVPKQSSSTKKELSSSSSAGDLPSPLNNLVKSEPIDMASCTMNATSEHNEDSNDSTADIVSEPGGGGGNGNLSQSQDHDDNMQSGGHHNYLDSKLFAAAGASFNFSMAAALAADSLAGLNNQSHVSGVDGLAGTSQEHEGRGWEDNSAMTTTIMEEEESIADECWDQMSMLSMSAAHGINSTSLPVAMSSPNSSATNGYNSTSSYMSCRTTCPVCNKRFSRSWSLQRHMVDMHYPSERRHNCIDCGRSYRSRNSLTSHRCQYHGKPKLIYN